MTMKKRTTRSSQGVRILITAGPTREYIDPVRYLSNDSSGRMGFALAGAAYELGFTVDLIAGPVELETPDGVSRTDVISAKQMHDHVIKLAPKADIIIMAAAVSDWRPARLAKNKIKKGPNASIDRGLKLKLNPDILAEVGKKIRDDQTLVGFALETKDLEKNARKKLKAKGCDWIIANRAENIGSKSGRALLIPRKGKKVMLPRLEKHDLAFVILSHIA
jgi:phosphopantothenoylcysteine decarboxylase / phosphopantothenate---cysteine ligase